MEDLSQYVKDHPMRRVLGTPKGEDRDAIMKRAINSLRFVAAVARDRNTELGREVYGLQKKASGDFPHVVIDGQGYWGDGLRTRDKGVDIVSNREGETAAPSWGGPGDADAGSFLSAPPDEAFARALGETPDAPQPAEPKPPVPPVVLPVDVVTHADLQAAIVRVHTAIWGEVDTTLRPLRERVATLENAADSAPGGNGDAEVAAQLGAAIQELKAEIAKGIKVRF